MSASLVLLLCTAGIAWSWLGYPLCLWLLQRARPRRLGRGGPPAGQPADVCVIMAVHNEAGIIGAKLDNLLSIAWPTARREIVVVSDASTDATDEIVRTYAPQEVTLVSSPMRVGKDRCLRQGVAHSTAPVIVFTDAATMLEPQSLRALLRHFSDAQVACVSGVDLPESSGGRAEGEGLYVRYEMQVRRLESAMGAMVGASGCLFAVRRACCEEWRDDLTSDFALPLSARLHGLAVITDEEAIGRYRISSSTGGEFVRKVRTVLHGLRVLSGFATALVGRRAWFLLFQLASHKLLRWSTPLFVLGALAASVRLASDSPLWQGMVAAQLSVWMAAAAAMLSPSLRRWAFVRGCLYFAVVNVSTLLAWLQFARGERQSVWQPTRR